DSHLELHHFEVFLPRPAFGAGPVRRHVLPLRSRRDAFLRGARGFVVDPAANEAHVLFHRAKRVGVELAILARRAGLAGPAAARLAPCLPTAIPSFLRSFSHSRRRTLPAAPGCRPTSSRSRAWGATRCRSSPRSRYRTRSASKACRRSTQSGSPIRRAAC